jgi:hypothetical protein
VSASRLQSLNDISTSLVGQRNCGDTFSRHATPYPGGRGYSC